MKWAEPRWVKKMVLWTELLRVMLRPLSLPAAIALQKSQPGLSFTRKVEMGKSWLQAGSSRGHLMVTEPGSGC